MNERLVTSNSWMSFSFWEKLDREYHNLLLNMEYTWLSVGLDFPLRVPDQQSEEQ